jgi:DNA-binding response OmpR family regulator
MATREAGPGRVLVVEDDESTALFVTRVLARHGFDAAWVTDAEQASERLDAESFDVLLADFRLPGGDGMELARDTRRSQPTMGIAVMTSFAETNAEETARSYGADDFFEKPLQSSNFVARIRDLVARSRAARMQAPSPSARGPIVASPTEPAPEASPRSDASSAPDVAGSGSGERAVARDTTLAHLDATADGAAQPRHEGIDGDRRARFTAFSDDKGPSEVRGALDGAGSEGRGNAFPREEGGGEDSDLLARVTHPAISYLVAQALAAHRVNEPVIMWASGAPSVSIGSHAGRVTAPLTRPGWALDS